MVVVLFVALVIGVPLTLGSLVLYTALPRSHRCPGCTGDTIRVQSRRHRLATRLLPDQLQLRWCPSCEWQGTVRLRRSHRGAPAPAPRPPREPESRPHRLQGSHHGVRIRSIEIDGVEWGVEVQCWAEAEGWRGRLVFVGPLGRVWCEAEPVLSGGSALDVLSRALALSERSLVGRIRAAGLRPGDPPLRDPSD